MKKVLKMMAAAVLSLSLCACGNTAEAVPVEQVRLLSQASVAADRFGGVVVSENAVKIDRDMDKAVEELYVSVGDEVRANEKLFSYDIDELNLTIDKQELEMDRLEAQIKDLKTQITNLQKQINSEKDKEVKATLELQLRSVKADLTQAEYDKPALKTEIDYNKNIVQNAVVRSPIAGTVRSINEDGAPYITIQQSGAYQIKGILNEMSLNAGIMEGVSVTIHSRVNPDKFWNGYVVLVDYNNTVSNEYDEMYGNMGGGMSTSTSYPFYINLESTEGLLLGQHVYIQIASASTDDGQLRIPENYVMNVRYDESADATMADVWTLGDDGNLTQRAVTLGEYDISYGTYVVADGLYADSYVADPAHPGCAEGAQVSLRSQEIYTGTAQTNPTEQPETTGETGGEE